MAVAAPPTTSARPPFWRDARVLRWAFQIVVLLAVLALLYWLYNNVVTNLRASRLPRGFGFLDQPYGSDIRGSAFRPAQPIRDAFVVGYFNTIRVIAVGIPAATIIGIVVGISRLSDNALVRAFGTLYVEVLRNIPPLASQYLNITKNSSLAVVVGYYEITRVYQTVTNNAAPPPQAIIVLMALYLTFSLGISLIANIINRRLQLETR